MAQPQGTLPPGTSLPPGSLPPGTSLPVQQPRVPVKQPQSKKRPHHRQKAQLSAETMLHEWSKAIIVDAAEQLSKTSMKIGEPVRVASELAVQVEARLKTVVAEARLRTWARRGDTLTVDDLNGALEARGEERCLGSSKKQRFGPREVDLKKRLATAKTPVAPIEPSVALHWLAIDGVQPDVPENPDDHLLAAVTATKNGDAKKNGPVMTLPVNVTKEHELYVQRIVSVTREAGTTDDVAQREVFHSLRRDDGLATVAPAVVAFCCAEATAAKKRSVASLQAAVAAMRALALNPKARIEPVLHDLLPGALTLVVAKRLGNEKLGLAHYDLRRDAARCVASVCFEFGDKYHTLYPRVAQTYADALKDPAKPLAVKFGAVAGVDALGPLAVAKLLVPRATDLANLFARSVDDDQTTETRHVRRTRQHHAAMERLLAVDALNLAIAQHFLRHLVLTYTPRETAEETTVDPPRKRRRLLGGEAKDDLRRRRRRPDRASIDLDLLDTFGETLVPFCPTIPAAVFL